jgi:Tfp pilus assembly protein PilV
MRHRRSAYTLLEVILSLAIAVLVMAAVYSVIGYQLQHAQAGREAIERATLARAIFNRMGRDVTAAIAQNDPARFRRSTSGSGGATDASSATGAASGTTGATSAGTTTPATSAASGTTGTGAASGGSATTGGTSGTSSDSTGTADSPVQLPLGVVGTATELHLFVSKMPQDGPPPPPTSDSGSAPPVHLTSDLQRISYWLGDQEVGLCRFESRLITSDEATNPSPPSGDTAKYQMAHEVRSLEFSYFDGTSWAESWDSTSPGPDGTTPLGSPRAVAIKIGVSRSGNPDDPELRYYRQVFTILTAGGTPVNNSTTDPAGTTAQSTTP